MKKNSEFMIVILIRQNIIIKFEYVSVIIFILSNKIRKIRITDYLSFKNLSI